GTNRPYSPHQVRLAVGEQQLRGEGLAGEPRADGGDGAEGAGQDFAVVAERVGARHDADFGACDGRTGAGGRRVDRVVIPTPPDGGPPRPPGSPPPSRQGNDPRTSARQRGCWPTPRTPVESPRPGRSPGRTR